jgi:phospholipid/cholesterol/gamma-HCH transport system substrate-binding protein
VTFVFPHATNLFAGSRAQIEGFPAGQVKGLEVRDGKALVRVAVDDDHAPLRAGTTARIDYQSLPGERTVAISPGPEDNAALPDGAMITGNTPRVELDQILTALDPETRAALRHLIPELDATLAGHEEDLGATLEAAGPAVDALADVLVAIGEDGPALHRLLGSVREMSERLVARKDAVRQMIDGFDRNLAQAVLHIILSHHGSYENGSPVVPATREATLVHAVDNLGGKLGSFDRIERQLPDGATWSRFDRGIDSAAYFGTRAA